MSNDHVNGADKGPQAGITKQAEQPKQSGASTPPADNKPEPTKVAEAVHEAMAKRALTFDELPPTEQIRRLKAVVLEQSEQIRMVFDLVAALQSHQHGAHGEIMVPMMRGSAMGLAGNDAGMGRRGDRRLA
jgi:hypothetical protein